MNLASHPPIMLLTTTGSAIIDDLLRTVVQQYEQHFPRRIRGYYVEGSYADGTAVPTSDLDLRIVFKEHLPQSERDQFAKLATICQALSPLALDLKAESEADLLRVGAIRFNTRPCWPMARTFATTFRSNRSRTIYATRCMASIPYSRGSGAIHPY